MVHTGYNPALVVLSVVIAVFASYAALDLGARVRKPDVGPRWAWGAGAAVAMGGGIWAMHFVGMIAFEMGMPAAYDLGLTLLSLLIAIGVTAAAFAWVAVRGTGVRDLLVAGPLMGVGVAAMHYTGMAAMRVPGNLAFDPLIVADSGAIVLVGALNMGEYAYNLTGENEHDGPSRNPHDLNRLTGGSSGGSAAAVAAGFVPLALGSDTNGSIRVPSSLCGTFGLKPTYGRLSRAGSFPFVASLDHLGPLARSVDDLALAYDLMQGADVADPVQARRSPELTFPSLDRGTKGLRIARAGGYFRTGGTVQALAAVDQAAEVLGATRVVEIPESAEARAAALLITAAEGAALHLGRLREKPHDFGATMRERTIAGACIPAVWVERARRFRRRYHARCLIPGFDGALFTLEWRDALWARFFTGAPRRLRRSVERSSIAKRA